MDSLHDYYINSTAKVCCVFRKHGLVWLYVRHDYVLPISRYATRYVISGVCCPKYMPTLTLYAKHLCQ